MRVSKDEIIEMLRRRGQHDRATAVDSELPDPVDTSRDAHLLHKAGVDPREMVNRLPPGALDK